MMGGYTMAVYGGAAAGLRTALCRRRQVGLAVGSAVMTIIAILACMFALLGGFWAWAVALGAAQGSTFRWPSPSS